MTRRTKKIPMQERQQQSRPCNHGDLRICSVCQFNDDCPYRPDDEE